MTAPRFPYPVLLSDVGGTNARFACIAATDAGVTPVIRVQTGAYPDFASAARDAVARAGFPPPASLIVGAAGPVRGRQVSLTNARWTIDGPATAAGLGLKQGLLLNDFEPLAMALPALGPSELRMIGPVVPGGGNRVVIGPGTGLGVGALIEIDDALLPLQSEGGHIGVGPEGEAEQALFRNLGYGADRIRAEMLLSGPALPRLHDGSAMIRGMAPARLAPQDVIERASAGSDPVAAIAVETMLAILARFSADMALTFMAAGGVYLAGGILPRIGHLLDEQRFRAAFERNTAHARMLREMPVALITADEPAFIGLAALARNPERYLLRYKERLWV